MTVESRDTRRIYRGIVNRQFSFIDENFVGERVTVEEAFERVGGFGLFQKYSCLMNTLANMGAIFFLLSFAFLEKEPAFKCQISQYSDTWTYGTEEMPLRDDYCEGIHYCEVDWSNPQSLHNLIE